MLDWIQNIPTKLNPLTYWTNIQVAFYNLSQHEDFTSVKTLPMS